MNDGFSRLVSTHYPYFDVSLYVIRPVGPVMEAVLALIILSITEWYLVRIKWIKDTGYIARMNQLKRR